MLIRLYPLVSDFVRLEHFQEKMDYLSERREKKITDLVRRFENVFACNKFDVGTVRNFEVEINLREKRYVAKKTENSITVHMSELSLIIRPK